MTLEQHIEYLAKCCRICGTLFAKIKKAVRQYECMGRDDKSGVPFSELLQHVFTDVFVEYDDEVIHPKTFCHKCFLVVNRSCKAQEQKKIFKPAARGYPWAPHSEDCTFCKRFVGQGKTSKCKVQVRRPQRTEKENLNVDTNLPPRNGCSPVVLTDHSYSNVPIHTRFLNPRKRKREDEDEAARKKLIMDTENPEGIVPSMGSPFSVDLCLAVPLHSSFLCGICQGIVNNPYKTKCNHLFCENCIKPWVMRFACCGKCEELVRRRDLKPCDQHFRDLILSLPMQCMNASCPAPLTVDTFTEHTNSCTRVDEEPELHDVSSVSETAEEDGLPT